MKEEIEGEKDQENEVFSWIHDEDVHDSDFRRRKVVVVAAEEWKTVKRELKKF